MNISLLAFLECFFFGKKKDFWPVFRFSAKRKNGRFSVIPARTGSVLNPSLWAYFIALIDLINEKLD